MTWLVSDNGLTKGAAHTALPTQPQKRTHRLTKGQENPSVCASVVVVCNAPSTSRKRYSNAVDHKETKEIDRLPFEFRFLRRL